jgi:hypothetical protein
MLDVAPGKFFFVAVITPSTSYDIESIKAVAVVVPSFGTEGSLIAVYLILNELSSPNSRQVVPSYTYSFDEVESISTSTVLYVPDSGGIIVEVPR